MSLDIWLEMPLATGNEEYIAVLYEANITHNLNNMAKEAGLYEIMWRPDEIGVRFARDAVYQLEEGIKYMLEHKVELMPFTPDNGWGSYEGLLRVAQEFCEACYRYPNALIKVSR